MFYRQIIARLAALASIILWQPSAFGFGGEDMINGLPWHHEDITAFALTGEDPYYPIEAKFGKGAADSIAWHADNIDSYLYNPLFWAQGGASKDRTKAALVGFSDLAKLHFDDTFTNTGIRSNWERYASGTLAGLYWASLQGRNGDVAAGQAILGVSFHAVQDFYSHSNWVSQSDRRCYTYFETQKDYRNQSTLFSGAYEKAASGAPAHHGAYSLSCSIFGRESLRDSLDVICSGYSPMQNASMCESFRVCRGSQNVQINLANPLPLPNSATIYLNPQGIALDNTHLAKVQAKNRNMVDENGQFKWGQDGLHFAEDRCPSIVRDEGKKSCENDNTRKIFAGTKDLAIRGTIEWAEYLEEAMTRMGGRQRAFWNRLKSSGTSVEQRAAQYENFSQLPYQFLGAGPYPTGNPSVQDRESAYSSNGWYLRLRIKTADEYFAGTNADIYADVTLADGTVSSKRLDYLPTNDQEGRTNNRLLVYDDFEAGDDDVYTIGPFAKRPDSFRLRNQDKSAGDVFEAIYRDLVSGIDHTLTDLRQLVIGLIGGNADYVGQDINAYKAEDLKAFGLSKTEKLEIRGRDEGDHDVIFNIIQRPELLTARERQKGWVGVRVALRDLHTIHESKFDRGTDSDEPFVLFQITPLNGEKFEESFAYVSPPFDDMDDDETATFPNRNSLFKDIKLPPEGMIVVAAKVFESDSENEFDRQTLLTEFVTNLDEATQRPAGEFFDALATSLAEDWTPASVEAFAFQRGRYPVAAEVLRETPLTELVGGESTPVLRLDWRSQKALLRRDTPILELKNDHPPARNVLEGEWFSDVYYCGEKQKKQKVRIDVSGKEGNTVLATKTEAEGDKCVGKDEVTFKGEFKDGDLTGKRYIVPPEYERPKHVMFPDGDPLLDKIPDYADPAIHPLLGLEGNWEITWTNSDEPPAKATLTKGGTWTCPSKNGGCWYQFLRDPAAPWSVHHFPGRTYGSSAQSVNISADGQIKIEWDYGHMGHWGGDSTLSASGLNRISGSWKYGDDKSGAETWTRAIPKVTHIGMVEDDQETRVRVGKKLALNTKFVPHNYFMRGNRSAVRLRLYGENLWGRHQMFIPWSSDLEISKLRYICAPGQYSLHGDWGVCEQQGGTLGVEITMNIWSRAETKEHTLIFDGMKIPFDLNVIGEPMRYPEWQEMKMEMLSCGVLEEVDREYNEHPFRLTRSEYVQR